jgi:hypothetical protein
MGSKEKTVLFTSKVDSTRDSNNYALSECEGIYNLIKREWRFDEVNHEYKFGSNANIRTLIGERVCFIGKSRDNIIEIFGKPSISIGKIAQYELKRCSEILKTGYCNWIEFEYDSKGKVVRMEYKDGEAFN